MYDRILLPTDGSQGVQAAVDHAIELASFTDATICALHVVDRGAASAVPEAQAVTIDEILGEAGRRAIEAVVEQADAHDIPVETAIRHGRAHGEIVAGADEMNADVIVMGTHGRAGLDRVLLGSVADRVIRNASKPVLVVRSQT